MASTERDIAFSLRLDALASRIEAAEATVADLRRQYAELLTAQRAEVDSDTQPRANGTWLGHEVLDRAAATLHGGEGARR